MTLERRWTVEPTDIAAVSFECGHCGAAFRVPVSKLDGGSVNSFARGNCGECGTPTGLNQGSSETQHLIMLCTALKSLSTAMVGRNLRVKLNIAYAESDGKP